MARRTQKQRPDPASKRAASRKRKKRRRKKRMQRITRQAAYWMTGLLIALHAAMLLTWWLIPRWDPPRVQLFELIWAWMHQPTFYPFIALLLAGPVLSVFAWYIKGNHRRLIVASWIIFLVITFTQFSGRAATMARVLWWAIN